MNLKSKKKGGPTTLQKCILVDAALSGRRPQTVTQVLLKKSFINTLYYHYLSNNYFTKFRRYQILEYSCNTFTNP